MSPLVVLRLVLAGGVLADAAGGRLRYVWLMPAAVAGLARICAAALAVPPGRGGGPPPGA